MEQNNEQVQLTGKLDQAKTKAQINADIKRLQKNINNLQLDAGLDDKTTDSFGKRLKEQLKQAAGSFRQWLSPTSAASALIKQIKAAISGLKEINTLLTKIGNSNAGLSQSDISRLSARAFDAAGRTGGKPSDYLSGVQDALLKGYKNAEEIAELSLTAQNAFHMTSGQAGSYIYAMDKAYQLGGSIKGLTDILDGSGSIAARYSLDMAQLSEGKLELAVIQHPVVPEISVFAGSYYLEGALIARFSSDPDSAHKAAHISESGFSHTADPETSAVMFAVLISQPFLELGLHLVLIDKLDSVLLIHAVALFLVHHINQLRLVQPFHHVFGDFVLRLDPFEGLVKGHVKFIEIRLALNQNHPGKVIKLCQTALAQPLVQRLL